MPDPLTLFTLGRGVLEVGRFAFRKKPTRFENTPEARRLRRLSKTGAIPPAARARRLGRLGATLGGIGQRRRAKIRGRTSRLGPTIATERLIAETELPTRRALAEESVNIEEINRRTRLGAEERLGTLSEADRIRREEIERGERNRLVSGLGRLGEVALQTKLQKDQATAAAKLKREGFESAERIAKERGETSVDVANIRAEATTEAASTRADTQLKIAADNLGLSDRELQSLDTFRKDQIKNRAEYQDLLIGVREEANRIQSDWLAGRLNILEEERNLKSSLSATEQLELGLKLMLNVETTGKTLGVFGEDKPIEGINTELFNLGQRLLQSGMSAFKATPAVGDETRQRGTIEGLSGR